MIMINEIGSEFHEMPPEKGKGLALPFEAVYTFSGRGAIETMLNDLPGVKKAALPSYCCDSMAEPFRRAGIALSYYPVDYDGNAISVRAEIPDDASLVLRCNYFGFQTPMPDLSGFNGVVAEDVTHSLFSDPIYHEGSRYLVASLRKWEPILSGGFCAAVLGKLRHVPAKAPAEDFLSLRARAMTLKKEYLADGDGEKKKTFLSLFRCANQFLADHYSETVIDERSAAYLALVDRERQRERRRQNARILYEGLQGKASFLFPLDKMDCPLFVPILLNDRARIRQALTDNGIYCPIHWPRPNADCRSGLYDLELSLICDQRYGPADMERIVSVLAPLL
ncbi:MAG: hypothetical protein II776_02550 [Clostridia bacterium]|nr:hypothetical protein [Clostridia bacterium]